MICSLDCIFSQRVVLPSENAFDKLLLPWWAVRRRVTCFVKGYGSQGGCWQRTGPLGRAACSGSLTSIPLKLRYIIGGGLQIEKNMEKIENFKIDKIFCLFLLGEWKGPFGVHNLTLWGCDNLSIFQFRNLFPQWPSAKKTFLSLYTKNESKKAVLVSCLRLNIVL